MSSFFTPKEASAKAEASVYTILNWCKQHPALGHKVGGRWRIKKDVLEQFLAGDDIDPKFTICIDDVFRVKISGQYVPVQIIGISTDGKTYTGKNLHTKYRSLGQVALLKKANKL